MRDATSALLSRGGLGAYEEQSEKDKILASRAEEKMREALAPLGKMIRSSSHEQLVRLTGVLVGLVWEARHRLAQLERAEVAQRDPIATGYALDSPDVISVKEAARLLGVNETRVYRLARDGKMPGVYRLGRTYRMPRAGVLAMKSDVIREPDTAAGDRW